MGHAIAASILLENLASDADGFSTLHLARTGLREERWGKEYAEAIGQSSMYGTEWPMEQLAAFAYVHALIYGGHVATIGIATAGTPRPDREREANAATLARLPHPFSADVDAHQHNDPGDGTLRWDCPIRVHAATGLIDRRGDGSTSPIGLQFQIPPGWVPLEIGSTMPSRTFAHLNLGTGVARWPYGHSRIRLLVCVGPGVMDQLADQFMKLRDRTPAF